MIGKMGRISSNDWKNGPFSFQCLELSVLEVRNV